MLLAIPSVIIGWLTIEPLLFGDFLKGAIHVNKANDVIAHIGEYEFHGVDAIPSEQFHIVDEEFFAPHIHQ